jgi:Asp-tRNA(Asn)/Glu-tRNA(Gln) amidotransferase A subunit family amidase
VPGVAPSTFVEAEKLAGIQFSDAERRTLSVTIGEQLERIRSRHKMPPFPNSLAPALVFDPRLPGSTRIDQNRRQQAIARSLDDPGPLPRRDDDIAFAPVSSLSRWIERRQLSSARLTDIYLARIKRFDPKLKCVITLCEEHARKQAARADEELAAGKHRGPLHGVPWGAKDLLDTKGIRTTWGAEPFRSRVPKHDAAVVTKLTDAGAVLIAKLSLGALAYNDIWFGGRTNNPWNLSQGSSGSSAGSAAATAAGLVGFSIGTETYGSITSPCMRCGTTGLRPTFGRISRAGAMALCWSLDKIGPICRAVEDCALVLDAINGPPEAGARSGASDAVDPAFIESPFTFDATRSVTGLRVGYCSKWFAGQQVHELDRQALDALRRTGAKVVEIEWPDWPYDVLLNVLLAEAAAAFEELTRSNRDDELKWQDPEAWPNTFRKSWFIPAIEVVQADRFRRRCMQMMAEKLEHLHAIIGPSFGGSLCLVSNHTGHPSLTLRSGFRRAKENDSSSAEVPYGITLIGRLFDEGTLCRIGLALEHELGVWDRRPVL